MNNFYVYELCSSENPNLPFYIGKGFDRRMYHHEWEALKRIHTNKYVQKKILTLKKNGYYIVYRKIAENISEPAAFIIEKDMIAFNRGLGFNLCNITNGGGNTTFGIHYHLSKETILKMKKPKTKEHRNKISIALKQSWKNEEHRNKRIQALIGMKRFHSKDWRLKHSKAMIKYWKRKHKNV